MIDEDVPCEDILSQLNAAKSALHKCGQVVLEGHIKHCVKDGIEHGDADKTIENFTKAVDRFSNMGLIFCGNNLKSRYCFLYLLWTGTFRFLYILATGTDV